MKKRIQRKCVKDRNRLNEQIKKLEKTNLVIKDKSEYKSNNAKKRSLKLAKMYRKIHNIYDTYIRTIAKNTVMVKPKAIVMEDLQVEKMRKHHFIASKLGFYTPFRHIRDIFEWNCSKYNVPFILAPKDYPSTKMCSKCGNIKNIWNAKTYVCYNCGAKINRDINASFNLENYYYNNYQLI